MRTTQAMQPPAAPGPAWQLEARCRGELATGQPDPWYPVQVTESTAYAEAREICEQCPVRAQCLAVALAAEGSRPADSRWGMWGGLTPAQRARRARAARAAQTTQENR